jgi:hypothetical protein
VWLRVLQPYAHARSAQAATVSRYAGAVCMASAGAGVRRRMAARLAGFRSALAAYSALDRNTPLATSTRAPTQAG